jgi:hypothetical protein
VVDARTAAWAARVTARRRPTSPEPRRPASPSRPGSRPHVFRTANHRPDGAAARGKRGVQSRRATARRRGRRTVIRGC